MAKLGINTGTVPDDGTGDSLLDGAIKINSNFNEIYNYFGNGTSLNFTNTDLWNKTSVGINTISNVGIGTTNPTSKLSVVGDGNFTGVVTGTTFVKSGGTSSQFLKADGSVDSSTYLTSYTETDTLNSVTGRGNSTSNNISVGVLTATRGNFSGIVTSSGANISGVVTATSFSGTNTLKSREVVSATTGSIGAGGTTNLQITGYKSYSLLKVGISSAAWVVLYTDGNSRTSDASRSYLTDPTPGSGVISEVRTTTSGSSTFIISPGIIGWNNDVSVGSTIYAKVTNNEPSSATITVNLTVVKLED
jgi:hypothetical protein